MTNSREKGKRGEREAAELFRAAGYNARRGQQYSGDPSAPDILIVDHPYLHVEVKSRERHNFWEAMDQAEEDSGSLQTPIVFSKMKRKRWLVTMTIEDWFTWFRRYQRASVGGAKTNFGIVHEIDCDMDEDCTCGVEEG